MNKKKFNKGVLLTSFGSFWWGFFGVIYFKYISFAGHVEVLIHRSVWTAFLLIVTTFFFSKWSIFKKILNNKKKLFIDQIIVAQKKWINFLVHLQENI